MLTEFLLRRKLEEQREKQREYNRRYQQEHKKGIKIRMPCGHIVEFKSRAEFESGECPECKKEIDKLVDHE